MSLTGLEIDPITGQLVQIPATIPGSGIMAWTLPGSTATLGDITIDAPHGNVDASLGGVLQISLSGQKPKPNGSININAGENIDRAPADRASLAGALV